MIENTRVGFNAGKVWRILNEKGELSMYMLCCATCFTFEDTAIAIGWLAREGKIIVRRKNNMAFLSVNNVEFSFG